jgi:PIN domain nuclease of toxin-antitoxin system
MKENTDIYVLDTSALLTLIEAEAGTDVVEKLYLGSQRYIAKQPT